MNEINEKELMSKRDSEDFYKLAMDTFSTRRITVSEEVRAWVEQKKIRKSDIGRALSIHLNRFDESIKHGKGFTMKPNQLALFSIIYGFSCHEILFGNKKKSILPKTLSDMLRFFRLLSDKSKEEIILYMAKLTSEGDLSAEDIRKATLSVDHTKLMRYRLKEVAYDRSENVKALFPINIYSTINKYYERDSFIASVDSLMMIAMCLNMTLDQFCFVDYSMTTDLRLFDSDEIVTGSYNRIFVQQYLIAQYLDLENEGRIIQKVLSHHWNLGHIDRDPILDERNAWKTKVEPIFRSADSEKMNGSALVRKLLVEADEKA